MRSIASIWAGWKRRLRFGPIPKNGWGHGWRLLIFRYMDPPHEEVQVLAPVKGLEFDWDALQPYARGTPWPTYKHEPGKLLGSLNFAGHHNYLVTADAEPHHRLDRGPLIPGNFGGGSRRSLVLTSVRPVRLEE